MKNFGQNFVRQISGFGVEIAAVDVEVTSGRGHVDEVSGLHSLDNTISQVRIFGSEIGVAYYILSESTKIIFFKYFHYTIYLFPSLEIQC